MVHKAIKLTIIEFSLEDKKRTSHHAVCKQEISMQLSSQAATLWQSMVLIDALVMVLMVLNDISLCTTGALYQATWGKASPRGTCIVEAGRRGRSFFRVVLVVNIVIVWQ